MNIDNIKETFKKYVDEFDCEIKGIKLKYSHSLRVMEISKNIAKSIGMNDSDKETAILVGLLHDYGRFPQLVNFHTYKDSLSIDHADLAVELLFEKGQIKNFTEDISKYDEIYDAIKYHNKYSVPDTVSKHNREMCKLIRDADKLDILYLASIDRIRNDEKRGYQYQS